jgi:uncharacterized protein (DUF433 family)
MSRDGGVMLQAISVEHIQVSPDIRGGKPCIAGTRIAVEDVAVMHLKLGQSLIEIAGLHSLSLAAVHAAMSYYFDHRAAIEQRVAAEILLVEAMRESHCRSNRIEF